MKTIDVQEQPLLSFRRILGIALSGVRYRLFRAAVTVAVISVAMAFLMNILAESLIKKTVADTARERISSMRRIDRWIARLSVPQTPAEIIQSAAAGERDAAVRENVKKLGGLSDDELAQMETISREAEAYLSFFQELNYGRRRVLVGSAESTAIFDRLQDAAVRDAFFSRLADMKTVRFTTDPETFAAFLAQWPPVKSMIERIRAGQSTAIASIQSSLDGRTLMEALRNADGAFGDVIRQAGFSLTPDEALMLTAQVGDVADKTLIDEAISTPDVRRAVAAHRDVMPADVTPVMVWELLNTDEHAAWFLGVLSESKFDVASWTAGRVKQLAAERSESFLLKQAEIATAGSGGGLMGIGQRMTWLAIVSMLVCAVGIANAMLMSVTERFREIATLKCLGALDGFIMTVFLIEASILGFVGGIIGTLLGLIISVLRMLGVFKGLLLESVPLGPLLSASLLSLVVGILLAAISAVYPSLRAARLAPMEAMRIE